MSEEWRMMCFGILSTRYKYIGPREGYFACALIGGNKGTLRSPAGLSVYRGWNKEHLYSSINVPSKMCAPQVLTKYFF